jgi:hypothetical protein
MIAAMVNIVKKTVRQILHDRLKMKKIYFKMVPKNFSQEQKNGRRQICTNIIERLGCDLNLL